MINDYAVWSRVDKNLVQAGPPRRKVSLQLLLNTHSHIHPNKYCEDKLRSLITTNLVVASFGTIYLSGDLFSAHCTTINSTRRINVKGSARTKRLGHGGLSKLDSQGVIWLVDGESSCWLSFSLKLLWWMSPLTATIGYCFFSLCECTRFKRTKNIVNKTQQLSWHQRKCHVHCKSSLIRTI